MKSLWFIFVMFFGILFLSCESETTAFGNLNDYIVVADSAEAESVADSLVEFFFPGRRMPVYEPDFNSKFITLNRLPEYKLRKNLMLIGTLDGGNAMSGFLNKILPVDFKNEIRSGTVNFTWQNNLYAYSQNVLIFASPNIKSLLQDIKKRGPAVAQLLQTKYREQLKESMFDIAEQTDLEDYFLKVYGFTVRIQHDYFIAIEDQSKGFIWLRRLEQLKEISRDLYIKYYDNADTISLSRQWLESQRTLIAKEFFKRNEEIVDDETFQKDVYVGPYSAIKLEGTWRTIDLMIGGPLSLYSFYVPEQNRLYIIEGSVTAIGRRNTPYLDQLEIMAESFHIKSKQIKNNNN